MDTTPYRKIRNDLLHTGTDAQGEIDVHEMISKKPTDADAVAYLQSVYEQVTAGMTACRKQVAEVIATHPEPIMLQQQINNAAQTHTIPDRSTFNGFLTLVQTYVTDHQLQSNTAAKVIAGKIATVAIDHQRLCSKVIAIASDATLDIWKDPEDTSVGDADPLPQDDIIVTEAGIVLEEVPDFTPDPLTQQADALLESDQSSDEGDIFDDLDIDLNESDILK